MLRNQNATTEEGCSHRIQPKIVHSEIIHTETKAPEISHLSHPRTHPVYKIIVELQKHSSSKGSKK
ncbi:hypothetical protein GmHk_12G036037 [Glycine max]|nr:hypothetical protein GmHk_12G036037 [Glycine max]